MPVFWGTAAADRIVGSAAADQIYGLDGDDTLYGGDGDDLLAGGKGNDGMAGGKGNDIYEVGAAGDLVAELQGEGIDGVRAWISYWLTAHVENLTLGGSSNIDGVGNALGNRIDGNAGANMLYGGAGDDVLSGGAGDDRLSGVDGADQLHGGDGNDLLEGGAGDDLMAGGKGDDRYSVGAAGDRVQELAGEGVDEVTAWVSYRLTANVENLILAGTSDIDGVGNALGNRVTGNAGANKLYGDAGNDLLFGAAGDDRLYGQDGADQLYGGDGADYLDGGAAGDLLVGGKGDDVYEIDAAGDRVTELQGQGIDGVRAWISYRLTANVENLTLVGPGDLDGVGNALGNRISGNAGANMLYGGAGNDILSGGAGNDRLSGIDGDDQLYGGDGNDLLDGGAGDDLMAGGKGGDHYSVGAAGDRVQELEDEGIDEVTAWVSHRLADNVENLILDGVSDIDGVGNGLNNRITGNAGDNVLDGGEGGADVLVGGRGDDVYYIDIRRRFVGRHDRGTGRRGHRRDTGVDGGPPRHTWCKHRECEAAHE